MTNPPFWFTSDTLTVCRLPPSMQHVSLPCSLVTDEGAIKIQTFALLDRRNATMEMVDLVHGIAEKRGVTTVWLSELYQRTFKRGPS